MRTIIPSDSLTIVHVAQAIARSYGGVQKVLADLSKSQAKAGHEVSIISTNVDSLRGTVSMPPNTPVEVDGVRTFACSVIARSILLSPAFARIFKREVRNADIVHIHGLYRFPPTYAAYYARKRGIPYVIRPHGSLDPYLYGKSSRSVSLKRLYERWFDLPNLHGAGAIHYTAEDERERAAFLSLRAPSFVVPNGLDWEQYRNLPDRGGFRSAYGLVDRPLVLFLGRLHFKKGLDILIPAFDAVRRAIPAAKLAIVGPENDGYGQKVRSWVRERDLDDAVRFINHLDGADVVQAYVDSDVFVLPSYTENFGMTVVEAMACKLPVVISDQVNIHREVSAAGAGLVTRCDAEEVAQALMALLYDTSRRYTMGEAGRQFVHEHYTWPAIVADLTHEYERVIDRAHGAARTGI